MKTKAVITTKNRNLITIAVIAVTASIIAGTLVSTYMQQGARAQNQNQNQNQNNSTIGNSDVFSLRNLTGSVQVFPRLSQMIQSKANVTLSKAAMNAEKAVGANSHVISANLRIVNGYLVYIAHVVDANNNIHRVIVDAGNGKILSAIQFPFANALSHPGGRGMFVHYYSHGMYGRYNGTFFGHHGLNDNFGPRM